MKRVGYVMVDHLQMTSASISIFHLINTNTFILTKDGSVHLAHESDQLPDFLHGIQQRDFIFLSGQTVHNKQCCMYTNELGLTYLSCIVEFEGEEANIWVVGPILMQIPDAHRIDAIFHAETYKRDVMLDFVGSLKMFSITRIQSLVNVLNNASSIRQIPYRTLNSQYIESDPYGTNYMQHVLRQPDEKDTKVIEIRYELEKEIMNAVENGDRLKMKEIMSKSNNLFDFSERLPNQPVRAMKNMLIVFNTALRIAAEKGKVHPFFLHHISEKFAKQIERSDSINSLSILFEVMPIEYCDLVKDRAISGYSPIVQQAAQHIKVNFSKPLNLKQLAQDCLVHPTHLSRQFKKETDMTLTDFQNRMRIDEAKLLLKDSTSIDRIAGYVGFDDAGYFTRIFQKLEGMTPSKYRKIT
ncbi:AraC family transcriptional regulator [Paenibacillus macquariensis]|uniref:Helix-turn-helix domain-containing protein n=1 Tax=Paenibacillus macquariensis TaxID=948756 RepID=A0ABY1JN50_9BACL|nr:AraC family transcriptional regulator [Paenibacillus macquariensis]MEC0092232.1 AraC family transcriptional regulator [Paenibacillus macquariensis]SIQ48280.1 Helix-turn-helix domain-containing protein [Paenibacillus macquariensis]